MAKNAKELMKNKKQKVVVGVDPGYYGALCVRSIEDGSVLMAFSFPLKVDRDGKRFYDIGECINLFKEIRNSFEVKCVFLERVWAFGSQGAVSSFNFGIGYALWQIIPAFFRIETITVSPAIWQSFYLAASKKKKRANIEWGAVVKRIDSLFYQAANNCKCLRSVKEGFWDAFLIAGWGLNYLNSSKED